MVKQILTESGFKEGKTFKETRFLKPPKSNYAIYLDSYNTRGADGLNLLKEHDITIELYSNKPAPADEMNIENALNTRGIEYEKQERYWLESEQLYQTLYTFTYFEKI